MAATKEYHCELVREKLDDGLPAAVLAIGLSEHCSEVWMLVHLSFILTSPSLFKMQCTAGRDVKSLALNFASFVLFFLPFAMYFYPEHNTVSFGVVVGSMLISLIIPPVGWRRPHPYSDDPTNLPYPRKAD